MPQENVMTMTAPESSVWEEKRTRQRALYPRQAEALQLYAEGLTYAQVADRMELAVGTARSYIGACVRALGADSPTNAVEIARERGYIK
jgi:DNA-binding NarL/FixJ family response regulator